MRGPYYALISYSSDIAQYTWELGSFDRSDITFERDDYHDKGWKLKDLIVQRFETCPTQKQCDDFMLKMNNAVSS